MLLIYLILLPIIYCQTLNNVFQSLAISNPSYLSRPQDIRTATLTWRLKSGEVMANDKFSLVLPFVFRTKFRSSNLTLTADETAFALCNISEGSVYHNSTVLECTVTDKIESRDKIIVNGIISFDFVFNVGGSTLAVDISAAKYWISGSNIITWGDLETNVEFKGGPFFESNLDNTSLIFYSRSIPQNYEQVYLLGNQCSSGVVSGKLAITTNSSFDCTLFDLSSTNSLNDFYFPKTYSSIEYNIACSEDKKTLLATFQNIPEGYRVFLQGFMAYSDIETVKHSYHSNLTCSDGRLVSDSIYRVIKMEYGKESSEGNITTVLTSLEYWTNTYTSSTTIPCPPGETTETLVIQVPNTAVGNNCTRCTSDNIGVTSYSHNSSLLDTSIYTNSVSSFNLNHKTNVAADASTSISLKDTISQSPSSATILAEPSSINFNSMKTGFSKILLNTVSTVTFISRSYSNPTILSKSSLSETHSILETISTSEVYSTTQISGNFNTEFSSYISTPTSSLATLAELQKQRDSPAPSEIKLTQLVSRSRSAPLVTNISTGASLVTYKSQNTTSTPRLPRISSSRYPDSSQFSNEAEFSTAWSHLILHSSQLSCVTSEPLFHSESSFPNQFPSSNVLVVLFSESRRTTIIVTVTAFSIVANSSKTTPSILNSPTYTTSSISQESTSIGSVYEGKSSSITYNFFCLLWAVLFLSYF